jgi:hypothetical protein
MFLDKTVMSGIVFALLVSKRYRHNSKGLFEMTNDTVVVNLPAGSSVCTLTITMDVTTEKANAIAQSKAKGAVAANVAMNFQRAMLNRADKAIMRSQHATTQTDAEIDAANVAIKTQQDAEAAAKKAARAIFNGDPTK